LLKIEDGEISVNWEYFVGLTGSNQRDREKRCLQVLLNVGVLSYAPQNNWWITTGISSLSLFLGSTCYFTRRDDALAYARLEFGHTSYDWMIGQIARGQVISKEEVVGNNLL